MTVRTDPRRRRRVVRWGRRVLFVVAAIAFAFATGAVLRAPVSYPFDWVVNLGGPMPAGELAAPDDGKVRVVFLQHGLWRTATSLDRLERTLRAAGYDVVNEGYPSTEDRIEGHARRLRDVVERRCAQGRVDELVFVGHSMGGLVIQEYLRRPDARTPNACVYLATPHRGAILADKRRHWFLFSLVMGDQAAAQLATTDAFHRQPIPFADVSGALVGCVPGEGNRTIPGPDDGTVGCAEATFDGVGATIRLDGPGHTTIALRDRALREVLHFLKHGRFTGGGR